MDARSDLLVYTNSPLERDLDVVGPPSVELSFSSSAVDTEITAKLVGVHHDTWVELELSCRKQAEFSGFWSAKEGEKTRIQVQSESWID